MGQFTKDPDKQNCESSCYNTGHLFTSSAGPQGLNGTETKYLH